MNEPSPEIPELDPSAAAEHLERGDALFLDVRDPGSFAEAHVPGAVLATEESVQALVARPERDAKVIVYCYHGHSSLGGAAYLLAQGLRDVSSLSGGFEAWRGRFPVEP